MIEGAVSINNYSVFRGTIICHDGALGALNTGVTLDGRALTTSGSLTTNAITTTMLSNCTKTAVSTFGIGNTDKAVDVYPNPFTTSINFMINDASQMNNCELKIYNILGVVVINKLLNKQLTTLETSNLPSGIYFYKLVMSGVEGVNSNNKTIQSGKLISRQ